MSDKVTLEELQKMVPFYVNGTLDTDDRRAFDAAMESMPELREELDREQALQEQFVGEMDKALRVKGSPSETKVQSLFGSPAAAQPERGGANLAGALSFLNPANWNPAVTFALAAAAVGQTAFIASQSATISDLEDENFKLASGGVDCENTATILLEPSADASWADLNALLSAEGLVITGGGYAGPLSIRHREDENLPVILERLNASDLVTSAEAAS